MREIPLANGRGIVLVDAADYEWASAFRWHLSGRRSYAVRCVWENGKTATRIMHRELMAAPKGAQVDHIDGNGLNNQRSNLRLCSQAENLRNRRVIVGVSQFKGVCWHKGARKWMAQIQVNRKRVHLGLFESERDAARAYDAAAVIHHGPFASPNAPQLGEETAA